MSISRLVTFLICTAAILPALHAAVSERDFLAPGDGLLTYDDVNHREWLDLPETLDWSLAELHEAIGPRGSLWGFYFATVEDVTGLAASASVEWLPPGQLFSMADSDSGLDRATELVDLVGVLLDYSDHNNGALDDLIFDGVDYGDLHIFNILEALGLRATGGLTVSNLDAEKFESLSYSLVSVVSYPELAPSSGAINRPLYEPSSLRGGITLSSEPLSEPIEGPFWLFRSVVPEPSSVVLLLLGSGSYLPFCNRRFAVRFRNVGETLAFLRFPAKYPVARTPLRSPVSPPVCRGTNWGRQSSRAALRR